MGRFPRTSPVLVVVLVFGLVASSSGQTLQESAALAGTRAALAAQGSERTELNKPLWYVGAGVLGAGIGLVIGGMVNSTGCDDLNGFGLIGALYEEDCNAASTKRYLAGAAFASSGALMMVLARPRVVRAAPAISFSRGRATVNKTITF